MLPFAPSSSERGREKGHLQSGPSGRASPVSQNHAAPTGVGVRVEGVSGTCHLHRPEGGAAERTLKPVSPSVGKMWEQG